MPQLAPVPEDIRTIEDLTAACYNAAVEHRWPMAAEPAFDFGDLEGFEPAQEEWNLIRLVLETMPNEAVIALAKLRGISGP